jgi:hypothetical protein
MMPARRWHSEAKIGMAVGVARLAGRALLAGTPADPPPFAVVDDCNAEADRTARAQSEAGELAAGSSPDAGTLYEITTLNDLSASARQACASLASPSTTPTRLRRAR